MITHYLIMAFDILTVLLLFVYLGYHYINDIRNIRQK